MYFQIRRRHREYLSIYEVWENALRPIGYVQTRTPLKTLSLAVEREDHVEGIDGSVMPQR